MAATPGRSFPVPPASGSRFQGPVRHDHLWFLPDGTGLHAPIGSVAVEEETGRLCCHLCGRWFHSLGAHVRTHGYTAGTYREAMGLMRTRALVSKAVSASISARQTRRYYDSPELQGSFAEGQSLARSGRLSWWAHNGGTARTDPPERVRTRRDQLARGRDTSARQREQRLAGRLAALGAASLSDYLRTAYAAGVSVEELRRATGLGRERLRTAMTEAGVRARATGRNTPAGKRSRALAADRTAAERVGTSDLNLWLRERRREGWTLERLGAALGHSGRWVRWRLDQSGGA